MRSSLTSPIREFDKEYSVSRIQYSEGIIHINHYFYLSYWILYTEYMNLSIQIPTGSHVKAKAGEITDFKTPLFEIASDAEHVIPLAQKLSVSPSKIFHHLKKFVGEEVKKGDLLAINKGLFSTKRVISDYGGKIQEIDHTEGTIIITIKGKKNTVYSPIIGEVVEIRNKEIIIKIKEGKEFNLKKASGDFGGEVYYYKNALASTLISSLDVINKILIAESLSPYVQSKMEALTIKGYVTLAKLLEDTELPYAQIKEIGELSDIMKQAYPYCFIDSKSSKIIFYK